MTLIHGKGTPILTGFAEAVIDDSIEACCAWDFFDSRHKLIEFSKNTNGLNRNMANVNRHHAHFSAEFFLGLGFQNRQFFCDCIWKKNDDRSIDSISAPRKAASGEIYDEKNVTGSVHTLLRCETLENFLNVPQTKVTYVQHADLSGLIPVSILNLSAVGNLMFLSNLRNQFDKSVEIDKEERDKFVDVMKSNEEVYSEEEVNLISVGIDVLSSYDTIGKKKQVRRIENEDALMHDGN